MTLPNRHLKNQIFHGSKRVTQRQFLLMNDSEGQLKNDLGYIFARACIRHGQTPHAHTVMSNHYHTCLTDNTGKRSDFFRDNHHLSAKVVNKKRRRRESLWSSSRPGNTLLLDTKVIEETMLYIWVNPVEAGLVERVEDWDHFQILPKHWGKLMRFERPDLHNLHGESERYPEFIEIVPMPPAPFLHLPLEEVQAYFERRIKEEEDRIRAERKAQGKPKVLGMKKCLEQSPFDTPKKSVPMYERNPRFASTIAETASMAIIAMRTFWRQYKKRLEAFRRGVKAKFPPGTVAMRHRFGIKCHSPGRGDPHCPIYEPFSFP